MSNPREGDDLSSFELTVSELVSLVDGGGDVYCIPPRLSCGGPSRE